MNKETEFNKDEYSFAYPDGIEKSYWNQARNQIIRSTVIRHKLDKIIDVGCGRGIVTSFLFDNKIEIQGVELGNTTPISHSDVPIRYAQDATMLPIEESLQFKTISLFDVIEHIEKPIEFIDSLCRHFSNVDRIIITVPARQELWTNYDDYYGHYRRYDLSQLRNELGKSGFEIVENRYFFHSLYFAIRISNLFKKREISFNPPAGSLLLGINTFLGKIFYGEKFLFPKGLVGSSIICVAIKKK